MAYVPLPPSGERWERDDSILSFRPGPVPYFANVSRVRADEAGLPELTAAAREWFGARGRTEFTWFLGPSATPAGVYDRLLAAGAEPFGGGTAMLLDHAVPPVEGIEVREVATADELVTVRLLLSESGGAPPTDEVRAAIEAAKDETWQEHLAQQGRLVSYLAYLNGEPVAAGGLLCTDQGFGILAGGGTNAQARGRGCYRALVHARWQTAKARGLSALAVQASELSSPILLRLGFAPVAELALLRQQV